MTSWRTTPFSALDPWIQDWLSCEQCANSRVSHPRLQHRFHLDERQLPRGYWPESRSVFPLEYVLLEGKRLMEFGEVRSFVAHHFGLSVPRGRHVLFVHPGNVPLRRTLQRASIPLHTSDILCTPTSSFRSLLCWNAARPERAAIAKLALDIPISGVTRLLSETEVLGSIYTSRLLAQIPEANRAAFGFDFFPDVAGSYCAELNLGQIFRTLPARPATGVRCVPAFSFGSVLDGELYLSRLARSEDRAVALVENVIESYVKTTSYVMLYEGIAHEFHPQNVLFELKAGRVARVLLRDFYRSAVSQKLRLRNGRPMPEWKDGQQSALQPSRYLFHRMARKAPTAYLRVYGVRGVVWELSRALGLLTGRSHHRDMQRRYLRYWQEACAVWLGVWPKQVPQGPSLALNDAIEMSDGAGVSRMRFRSS